MGSQKVETLTLQEEEPVREVYRRFTMQALADQERKLVSVLQVSAMVRMNIQNSHVHYSGMSVVPQISSRIGEQPNN